MGLKHRLDDLISAVTEADDAKNVINTAEELKPILLEKGFKFHAIVNDTIPANKSVQKTTTNIKSERIMILSKI